LAGSVHGIHSNRMDIQFQQHPHQQLQGFESAYQQGGSDL